MSRTVEVVVARDAANIARCRFSGRALRHSKRESIMILIGEHLHPLREASDVIFIVLLPQMGDEDNIVAG